MLIGFEVPGADTLRRLREYLGLSQSELAAELGFGRTGEHVVRRWEQDPDHYRPTPLAWTALRLTVIAVQAYRTLTEDNPVRGQMRTQLSERLR